MPVDPGAFTDALKNTEQPETLEQRRSRILGVQQQQQQVQQGQLVLDQQKQDLADQKALKDALAQSQGDIQKARDLTAGKVSAKTTMGLDEAIAAKAQQDLERRQKLAALDKDTREKIIAQGKQVGGAMQAVASLPDEQQEAAYHQAVDKLVQDGAITPEHAQGMHGQFPGKTGLQMLGRESLTAAEQLEIDHKKAMENAAKVPDAEKNFQAFYKSKLAASGKAPNAKDEYAARQEYYKRTQSQVNVGGNLSTDALDQAAKRYLTSGELPPMGMGKQGNATRLAVLNRAAELGKDEDIAANKAEYKADADTLKKLNQQLHAVEAFESTAGKNLDLFLKAAEKVPDTGVPWLNTPLRKVSLSGVGSENMAAFNAARQVALTEIARVVNNPNLTGVLSDSARQEIANLNPESATFAQIKAVAKTLKQDMENRHSSIKDEVDKVKGGLHRQAPTEEKKPTPAANDPLGIR